MTVTVNYVDGIFNPNKTDEDLITITSYDVAGNRVAAQDPKGIVTQYQYDLLNRLTAVAENYVLAGPTTAITNVVTVYTYTVSGGLANIQDGRSKVSSFAYDLLDRQVNATDPLAHTNVYTYNEASDRIAVLDANGHVINYTYDLLDRQSAITYPAGTANVAFAYDVLSQRTVMTDGTGTTTWTFDAVGRPITITQPNVGNVGYGYDSASDRTNLTYPDGKVVTYTYDLAARLANATDWQAKTTNYSYNALGQPITVTLPNGVTSRYSYDNAGRLATIRHATALQTLAAYTYTVDAVGNRTQIVESTSITATNAFSTSHNSIASGALATNGSRGSVTAFTGGSAILAFTRIRQTSTISVVTISYAYDPLHRLTAANYSTGQVYTYTYDAVGNRLSEGAPAGGNFYAYDDANRLGTINGTTNYTWDNNGNLLNNGAGVTYTYDAENRLVALNASTYTYAYDGLGDRVQLLKSGAPITYTLDQVAGLTQVLAETTGALTTTYTYGLDRLSQQTITSTDYFLGDALGSVRELANANANVMLRKSYDAFGQTINSSGSDSSNYDFTGEYKDPSALLYLRARYYSSQRGRFIQKDTWADYARPRSLNAWAYVLGNSVNHTDPSGHCPMPPAYLQPAICLALFIKPPTVSVAGGLFTLHGDGRDFSSNSDPGASRGYLWLSTVNGKSEYHMNQTGYIIPSILRDGNMGGIVSTVLWFDPSPQNHWPVSPGGDGEYTVRYDLVLGGILEDVAPHINGTIRFRPNSNGGYGAIGVRDGFPWAEAYYWDGQGNVEKIFQRPALPNAVDPSENLNAIENPIPWCSLANLAYHGRDLVLNKIWVQGIQKSHPQIDAFATP